MDSPDVCLIQLFLPGIGSEFRVADLPGGLMACKADNEGQRP